ncbi:MULTISPECIES: iron-containing alcohol dehydrogenase [Deefgea]|uniref:Iron-containing alcohol dehydrogenase n=1 Tax=Deefgea chitinilytica TaxID=570276 RepID=A0ABS2C7J5_9NEIS|nr:MULTISPECIES: iron-containing alcohol dehydrogenase [Deefgea]MBM5570137.1 iron-containing alcohol dehydrogenase [Deefgea chitinilytica]MBM9887366.1 iron-containing alcohol dehydrogenase [Deefgea sp. CFH1-16]
MQNFSFHNPCQIEFGAGQISKLSTLIAADARILLLYGGGSIKHNGVYDAVAAALSQHHWQAFSGIEPNPEYETLMRAVRFAREQQLDFVLAVGGGSVIDGAKFVAAAIPHEGDCWQIIGNRVALKTALPIGVVLTLPATGSESNFAAVISRRETNDKLSFKNPLVFPQFAILDPKTTMTLPARQIGNGVVDAFVHTTEQYLSYPADARVQDRLAEGILQTLIEVGPQTLAEPNDYPARANLMWAANQALFGMVGLGQPQDWATHAMGHELTMLHGLDHAQTLAIILPALWRYRFAAKQAKLAQYGRRVWQLSGSDKVIAQAAIEKTEDFFQRMGLPTRLSAYQLDAHLVADGVAAQLTRHGRVKLGEHLDLTPDDCRAILLTAD